MKKINVIKSILTSTRYIRAVVFIQVFFLLLISVTYINQYTEISRITDILISSPFNNSILFMGHLNYEIKRDKEIINNSKFLLDNKEMIRKYIDKNKQFFKGMTPLDDLYVIEIDNDYYTLRTFDKNTLNIVNPYILRNNSFDSEEYIEILVNRKLKNKYPVDSFIKLNTKEKEIELKVVGYSTEEFILPQLGVVSSIGVSIQDIFSNIEKQQYLFITDDDNPNLKYFSEYKPKAYDGEILYLNENISRKDLTDFENYIKDNNLGYFQYSEDIFDEQFENNNYFIQKNLDAVIALITILIFSVLSVGYINKDKLEERFKTYYFNGANLKDIFSVSFIYYFILLFVPILFYNLFIIVSKIEFIRYNLVEHIELFNSFLFDDRLLHTREFIVLSLVLIIITSIISYWNVINIKNKYAVDRR